jgi:YVTN family beta-propeller protein
MGLSKSRTLQAGIAVACALLLTAVYADSDRDQKSVRLHSGWTITPAGKHEETGDMLLGCALSPDGQTLALTGAGYAPHMLYLVDTATGKIRQSLPLERAWNGVVWSKDGSALYVSGGASPRIHVFKKGNDGNFGAVRPIDLPDLTQDASKEKEKGQAYVAGLALSPDGSTLYAANIATDTIYALSLPDGKVKSRKPLAQGARPYCLRFAPDGSVLYVTQWALSSLLALDPNDLSTSRMLQTGNHPNDFVFAPDGRAFVSCGNDDTVVVLDPLKGQTHEQIRVSLTPRSPAGTTPNALALSPDGHSLFVANADNNAVAVIDISRPGSSRVRGFIPTGWYPTALCATPEGKRLFIASGKGLGTRANPVKKLPIDPIAPRGYDYIGTMLGGLISLLELPDDDRLAAFTRQVYANTPYKDALIDRPARAPRAGTNPVPSSVGDPSPIKHVLYIIKENRTYDQVFGAFKDSNGKPLGNGDPNLTLFGEDVTPNHHELARQYVLLDNTYCSGEVSADGHPWSTGAYVTDITARSWPAQYAGRGRQPLTEQVTIPPAGYIWDLCARKGLSYRSYGEYVYATGTEAPPGPLTSGDGVTGLKGHASAAWQAARAAGKRDPEKAQVFVKELAEFERTNSLPRFMIMSLGENHTTGTRPGTFTPKACVASNDVALGKIVEACTRSGYWKEMAIFVIEDDAQNGPDHVDAHRTIALVISPFTRRRHLDSTFYTTVSMLRTIELILGLPPMSQYDASATPMYNSFTMKQDSTPYTALPARIDLMAKNPDNAYGAKASLELDFSDYDRLTVADEDTLNRAIWHSIKGVEVPYPGPVRRALMSKTGHSIIPPKSGDDDDDEEERGRK